MAGPGMTKEEYPQFEEWLASSKLVRDREITEGQKERALRYFQKRFEKIEAYKSRKRTKKDKLFEAQVKRLQKLLEEGADLGAKGEHKAALERSGEALELARTLKNPDMELFSLNLQALALYHLGRAPDAIQCLTQALRVAQETDRWHARRETIRSLADVYRQAGQLDKALKSLQELARIAEGEGDLADLALTLSHIGHLLADMGQAQSAPRYFERAGQVLQKLLQEGADLGIKGEHKAALERSGELLKVARTLEDPDMELAALHLQGLTLSSLGRTDDSVQVLSEALDLAQATDRYRRSRQEIQRRLAETYKKTGQLDKALKSLQELAHIEQGEGDMAHFALTLSQIGHLLLDMEQTERAFRYFQRAGQVSQELRLLDENTDD